jgi:15-cis-phytoene synthase / lycopene beta-cyclase
VNNLEPDLEVTVPSNFPPPYRLALLLLPARLLSPTPLYGLLCGFKTDLEFHELGAKSEEEKNWPIRTESDLELYAMRVAGTIAELCLELVFYHTCTHQCTSEAKREFLMQSGRRMGIALQYVNIARDIATDAAIGRVYIPTCWLEEEGLNPQDVINAPTGKKIERVRSRILCKAFVIYGEARGAMEELPLEVQAPIKVMVESYMEIGRVLLESGCNAAPGRATVSRMRRIIVAWKALT